MREVEGVGVLEAALEREPQGWLQKLPQRRHERVAARAAEALGLAHADVKNQ